MSRFAKKLLMAAAFGEVTEALLRGGSDCDEQGGGGEDDQSGTGEDEESGTGQDEQGGAGEDGEFDYSNSIRPLKAMSANLYWWNVFGKCHGNGCEGIDTSGCGTGGPCEQWGHCNGSGECDEWKKNIYASLDNADFDLIGFQETDDMNLIKENVPRMGGFELYGPLGGKG